MAKSTVGLLLLSFVSLVCTLSFATAYRYMTVNQVQAGLTILPSQPVPEFPAGLVFEIAFVPLIIYIWMKKRQKMPR